MQLTSAIKNGKCLRTERQPNKWLAEWQIALHIYMPNESSECELNAQKMCNLTHFFSG